MTMTMINKLMMALKLGVRLACLENVLPYFTAGQSSSLGYCMESLCGCMFEWELKHAGFFKMLYDVLFKQVPSMLCSNMLCVCARGRESLCPCTRVF